MECSFRSTNNLKKLIIFSSLDNSRVQSSAQADVDEVDDVDDDEYDDVDDEVVLKVA